MVYLGWCGCCLVVFGLSLAILWVVCIACIVLRWGVRLCCLCAYCWWVCCLIFVPLVACCWFGCAACLCLLRGFVVYD